MSLFFVPLFMPIWIEWHSEEFCDFIFLSFLQSKEPEIPEIPEVKATLVHRTSFGDTVLLILALCFHSVFEGIAIGVAGVFAVTLLRPISSFFTWKFCNGITYFSWELLSASQYRMEDWHKPYNSDWNLWEYSHPKPGILAIRGRYPQKSIEQH